MCIDEHDDARRVGITVKKYGKYEGLVQCAPGTKPGGAAPDPVLAVV